MPRHILFLLPLFFPGLSISQNEPPTQPRSIEVTGTATIKAEVDQIEWRISLRGEGAELTQAAEQLDGITNDLRAAINDLENENVGLRFSRIRSGRIYETIVRPIENGRTRQERELKGYYVERDATVNSSELESSPEVERLLLRDNRLEISGLHLTSSKREDLKEKSLRQAVEAAHEKARNMISVFPDQKLGGVLMLKEGTESNHGIRITENRIAMPVFDGESAPEFDQVEVTTTVTLRMEIE